MKRIQIPDQGVFVTHTIQQSNQINDQRMDTYISYMQSIEITPFIRIDLQKYYHIGMIVTTYPARLSMLI